MPQALLAIQALEDALAEQDRYFQMVLQTLDGYERSLADLDSQLLPLVEAASRVGSESANLSALRKEAETMTQARLLLSRALETCTAGGAQTALPREFRKTALPRALFALFGARTYLLQHYPRIVEQELATAESRFPLISPTVQPYISPGCRHLYAAQFTGRDILQIMVKRASRGLLAITSAGQTADQPGQAVADAVSALAGGTRGKGRAFPGSLVEAAWGLVRQFLEFAHLNPYAPISMLCDSFAQAAGFRPPEFGEAARAVLLSSQSSGLEVGAGRNGGWPPFSLGAFSVENLLAQESAATSDSLSAPQDPSPSGSEPAKSLLTSPDVTSDELTRSYALPSPEATDDQFVTLNALVPLINIPPTFVDCLAQYLDERRAGLLAPFADVVVAGSCLSPRDATSLKEVAPLSMETKLNDLVRNCLTNFLAQLQTGFAAPDDRIPDPQGIMKAVRFQESIMSESLGSRPDASRYSKARGFSPETTYLTYGKSLLAQRREALIRERAKERRKGIQARDARSQARPSRSKYQPGSHPFLTYLLCLVKNLITERQYLVRLFCSILCYAYAEEPEPGFLLPENFPARQPGVFYSMCRLADACYQVIFYPAVRYATQVGLDLARAMAESGESCLMSSIDLVQNLTALLPVLMFSGFTELSGLTVGGLPLEYCPVSNAFELVTPDTNSPGSKAAVFVNGLGFVPESYVQAGPDEVGQKDAVLQSTATPVRQSVRWTGKFDPLSASGSQAPATSTFSFDPDELLQAQCEEGYVPLNAGAVIGGQGGNAPSAGSGQAPGPAAAAFGASATGIGESWSQDPAMAVNASVLALISAQAQAERVFGDETGGDDALANTVGMRAAAAPPMKPAELGPEAAAMPAMAGGRTGLQQSNLPQTSAQRGPQGPAQGPTQGATQCLFLLNPECVDFYRAFSEPMAHKPSFAITPLDFGRREFLYMCYVMARAAFGLHTTFEATLFQIRPKVQDPNVHEQVPVILNKLEQMLSYSQGVALIPKQISRGELVTQEVIESLEDQDGQDREAAGETPGTQAAESLRPVSAALPSSGTGPMSVFIRDAATGGEMLSPVPVAGAKAINDDKSSPDFFSLDPYLAPQDAHLASAGLSRSPGWAGMPEPLTYECNIYYLACLMVYKVQPLRHPSQTYIFRINTLNYIYDYVNSGSNDLSAAVGFDFREFLRHQVDKLIKSYIHRVWMPALTSLDVEALCEAIEHVYTKWYKQGNMGVTKEEFEHTMMCVENSRAACRKGRANVGYLDADGEERDQETSVGAFADEPEPEPDADVEAEAEADVGEPHSSDRGSGLTAEALAARASEGAESVAHSSKDSDATSDALTTVAPVRQNTPKVTVPKSKRIQGIMSVALPKFDKIVRPLIEQHREMFVSSSAIQERLRTHIQDAIVEPYKQYYTVCEMSAATSRYLQKYSSIRASDLERAVSEFFR